MSTPLASFGIAAIPPETLAGIRARGVDEFGHPLAPREYADGGYPLRCCLRESEPADRLALIAHCPFPWEGAYAEVGPVFIHAEDCGGYAEVRSYPEGYRHRQQIFRAYGHDRTIVDAEIVDGADAEQAIAAFLARPEVDFVHSRNVTYGCFMFVIHRAGD